MTDPIVLAVDDTAANLRLLQAVLAPRGFDVRTAESGDEALAAIERERPDVVLLDIQMPGMNGYEVCRRLRAQHAAAALPIVMVTASLTEERTLALEAGADDFVVRPFDQAELVARLRSLVRIKRYHDQLTAQASELEELNRTLEARVAEQVAELEGLRRLQRFLPPHLARLVHESPELLDPHRREIAIALCELRGFDSFAMSAEPEEAVDALLGYHELLGRLVEGSEATVGYYAGERVLLFFNDPVPCDEPVWRAVQFVDGLRREMGRFAGEWRRRGRELDVAGAITFGYATLGTIGFDARREYAAVGTVVNHAARLCDVAADGEVLLSQRAKAAVEDRARMVAGADDAWRLETIESVSAAAVEIRLLGPLEVVAGGRQVEVTASKERAVLALLALRRGQPVPPERLADELWDGQPPDSAVSTLRAHLSRLRKTLGSPGLGDALVTRSAGYAFDVGEEAVDVCRFELLIGSGRSALLGGDAVTAEGMLREAMALWRGEPLVDIASVPVAAAEIARLEELRLAATEDCIEAALLAGRHRDVASELEGLTRLHPLRERLWSQRMLALYRSGRQADALRVYQELRELLAEELGLDPSPELAALEQAIVLRDPRLDTLTAPA